MVGVSNPKAVVFLAAVLPQFVDHSAGGISGQLLALGLVFMAVALVSDSTYAYAAGTARNWFSSSPRRLARMQADRRPDDDRTRRVAGVHRTEVTRTE